MSVTAGAAKKLEALAVPKNKSASGTAWGSPVPRERASGKKCEELQIFVHTRSFFILHEAHCLPLQEYRYEEARNRDARSFDNLFGSDLVRVMVWQIIQLKDTNHLHAKYFENTDHLVRTTSRIVRFLLLQKNNLK